MAKRKSLSKRVPRRNDEFKPNPEHEKWCRERAASPEGAKLLDELASCLEAAVRRLTKEEELRCAALAAEITTPS